MNVPVSGLRRPRAGTGQRVARRVTTTSPGDRWRTRTTESPDGSTRTTYPASVRSVRSVSQTSPERTVAGRDASLSVSMASASKVAHETLPVVSQFSIATDSRGGSLVEGEHATEPFAPADAADGRNRIEGREGDDVAQALVVALGVVVVHKVAHDGAQVTLAKGDNVAATRPSAYYSGGFASGPATRASTAHPGLAPGVISAVRTPCRSSVATRAFGFPRHANDTSASLDAGVTAAPSRTNARGLRNGALSGSAHSGASGASARL